MEKREARIAERGMVGGTKRESNLANSALGAAGTAAMVGPPIRAAIETFRVCMFAYTTDVTLTTLPKGKALSALSPVVERAGGGWTLAPPGGAPPTCGVPAL